MLSEEGDPMQAREVHAKVEAHLGEPVRWDTVKATLAGNLDGPTPRFMRVARGRYSGPTPPDPACCEVLSTQPRMAKR